MRNLLVLIMLLSLILAGGATASAETLTMEEGANIDLQVTDGANPTLTISSTATDENVKVSADDTTAGFLNGKLVGGAGITLTEGNGGANETLTIAAPETLTTKGDVLVHDGTSETRLAVGASGQFLTSDTSGNLLWANPAEGDQLFNSNVLLNAYRTAGNVSPPQVLKMINGSVDAFNSETGVDATASTNEDYDSNGEKYKNLNPIGGNEDIVNQVGLRFQGIGDQIGVEYRVAQSFTTGTSISLSQVDLQFFENFGSPVGNVTVRIETDSSNRPSGTLVDPGATKAITVVPGTFSVGNVNSWVFSGGINLSASTQYWIVTAMANQAVDTGWIIGADRVTGPIVGGYNISNDGGVTWPSGNLETDLYFKVHATEVITENMTLVSNSQTAKTEPNGANIILMAEDVAADIVINTDLKASVSRDGGTTFTQVTLSDAGEFEKGNLLTGTVDISGQPTGTDMEWKVETLNNKLLNLHGVGLEWR